MTKDNQTNIQDERAQRLAKIPMLKEKGIIPYAEKYDKKHSCAEIIEKELKSKVQTAGRVMSVRDMGKIAFVHIQDDTSKLQLVFRVGEMEKENYKLFFKIINVGDFIGVKGGVFKTQKGEMSILVDDYTFLSKALKPLPEKWHGLKDRELKYRKRYLDLTMNKETREVFKFRSDFIREMRAFYHKHGFTEIDTPVLCNTASGALAKPFKTRHNAMDMDVYLRIAPEIFLKEAIIGGYERVFEVARCFRNEGMDPSHLQDFTMVEHYTAYWNYEDNMRFMENMLKTIVKNLMGTMKLEILDREGKPTKVDLSKKWETISFRDILIKDCGIDIDKYPQVEDLRKEIKKKKIEIEDMEKLGRGNLIDSLYKEVSRQKIVEPTFLVKHPTDVSPLARKNDDNPNVTDRFQLIISGWEIMNAYSELIDPEDQHQRFEGQMAARAEGDEEAMLKDDDYVDAMEYGMPPISGMGMGIERIVALLTKQPNLRDVVLFPLMREEGE